jgi:hypothetical protein
VSVEVLIVRGLGVGVMYDDAQELSVWLGPFMLVFRRVRS